MWFDMNSLNKTIVRMDRWIRGWMAKRIDSLISEWVVSVFGVWLDVGIVNWMGSGGTIDRLGLNV